MPLTAKGQKILAAMQEQYGEEKGKQVFYAAKNAGTITGVDSAETKDARKKVTQYDPQGRLKSTFEEEERDSAVVVIDEGVVSPVTVQMTDTVDLDDAANVRITEDGYMAAFPRVARTGIQLYRGSECGRDAIDEVRVYRPTDAVFHKDATHSYTHLPVTIEHPKERLDSRTWKKYAVGETGDEVLRDGGTVRVPMMLRDHDAIQAVRDGKKQLSVGYACEIDWTPGRTDDGEQYDAIQVPGSIRANHLAVVATARGGSQLTIGDDKSKETTAMTEVLRNVTIDGLTCQMADRDAQIVQKTIKSLTDQLENLKKKNGDDEDEKQKSKKDSADTIAAKDAIIATKDAEIATLKTQLKDAEMTPAKMSAMLKDLVSVVAGAKRLMGDKFITDNKLAPQIKREVVDGKLGEAAKGWTEDQVDASFNTLSSAKTSFTGSIDHARTAFATDVSMDAKDQAWNQMVQEQANAWKQPERQSA